MKKIFILSAFFAIFSFESLSQNYNFMPNLVYSTGMTASLHMAGNEIVGGYQFVWTTADCSASASMMFVYDKFGVGIDTLIYASQTLCQWQFGAKCVQDGGGKIMIAIAIGDSVKIFHWSPVSSFSFDTTMASGNPDSRASWLDLSDMDVDGDFDIIVPNKLEDSLTVFWKTGNGFQKNRYFMNTYHPLWGCADKVICQNGRIYYKANNKLGCLYINPISHLLDSNKVIYSPLSTPIHDFGVDENGNVDFWADSNFWKVSELGTKLVQIPNQTSLFAIQTKDLDCDGICENVIMTCTAGLVVYDNTFANVLYQIGIMMGVGSTYSSGLCVGNLNGDKFADIGGCIFNNSIWSFENISTGLCTTGQNQNEVGPKTDKVRVFPNPATEIIHVSGLSGEIQIFDLVTGKILMSMPTQGQTTINISGLNSGRYLLKSSKSDKGVRLVKK